MCRIAGDALRLIDTLDESKLEDLRNDLELASKSTWRQGQKGAVTGCKQPLKLLKPWPRGVSMRQIGLLYSTAPERWAVLRLRGTPTFLTELERAWMCNEASGESVGSRQRAATLDSEGALRGADSAIAAQQQRAARQHGGQTKHRIAVQHRRDRTPRGEDAGTRRADGRREDPRTGGAREREAVERGVRERAPQSPTRSTFCRTARRPPCSLRRR